MNTYPQRIRESILPLSVASTLPEAFREWAFTGHAEDHETATKTCQLCQQEALRYQFEIHNRFTNATLMVGSQCILRFGVSVFEDGRLLSREDAQKKLNRAMQQMKGESCVRALEAIANEEDHQILVNALIYYRKNGYLSPKFAFVVLWRLGRTAIDYNPSFFKIALKKKQHQDDLRDMDPSRVRVLWPALTATQRDIAKRLGHTSPH